MLGLVIDKPLTKGIQLRYHTSTVSAFGRAHALRCTTHGMLLLMALAWNQSTYALETPVQIGSQRELFVDHHLIDTLEGSRLKLHTPVPRGSVLKFDHPWEGAFCGYCTVIKDGDTYRLYYRGLPSAGKDGSDSETTSYAESQDGVHWTKPNLGIYSVNGSKDNNIILQGQAPFSHNFSPFLDTKTGVPATQRFKALAGTETTGLVGFISGDGKHWRKLREKALITKGVFDSQNVAFWSESEDCYLCYFRTWTGGGYRGFRTVSRCRSRDFLSWSAPVPMRFGNTPTEHLYTNQTHPYFRAPHIYVAIPMRFMPGRRALTKAQAQQLGVHAKYGGDCADAVLMTSRGGPVYDRTFMEGFIRPGTDLGNWASRAGMTALGVVPTSATEMSIYKQAHYAQATAYLERYTLRTDGFTSLHGPYQGGEVLTRPLVFAGRELVINFATSAAGAMHIEIQNDQGDPVPGYTLADAQAIIGDDIARRVSWKGGASVEALAGKPIRLRIQMKDADLYSIQFH
jgi:hypothetical protein